VRAILLTLTCVIVSALLVMLIADRPHFGLFRPVHSASIGLIDH
jgi:hypothetical protein